MLCSKKIYQVVHDKDHLNQAINSRGCIHYEGLRIHFWDVIRIQLKGDSDPAANFMGIHDKKQY